MPYLFEKIAYHEVPNTATTKTKAMILTSSCHKLGTAINPDITGNFYLIQMQIEKRNASKCLLKTKHCNATNYESEKAILYHLLDLCFAARVDLVQPIRLLLTHSPKTISTPVSL